MKIIQLTPGAGAMYCGNCLRDNAMVSSMRRQGHDAIMLPLYLPLTLDENDLSGDQPIFFSGINVYLEQVIPWMRHMPSWFHRMMTSRWLLKLAAGKAAATRPAQVGALTLSMLRGEEGNQARELDELVQFLESTGGADVICLSNAMLIGMARQLHQRLKIPVVCMLQGEDDFLDALPPAESREAWNLISDRCDAVARFVAPTRYFAGKMGERLQLQDSRIEIIPNGLDPAGFRATDFSSPKTIGFFARMCPEKGLDNIVRAFIRLRGDGKNQDLRLAIGGSCGPTDQIFVNELKKELNSASLLSDVSFHPNLSRAEKQEFLSRLHVFSVPANYSEAFGLYLLEAMASGVPVVQPEVCGFPEIVSPEQVGWTYSPNSPDALAEALQMALDQPDERIKRGRNGIKAIAHTYHIDAVSTQYLNLFQSL